MLKIKTMIMMLVAALIISTPTYAQSRIPQTGDIIMGGTNAKRVTIIVAMSCVFCRALDRQIFPDKAASLVRKGYSIELIPVLLGPQDSVTTAVLRCGGVKGYTSRMKRLYESQSMLNGLSQNEAETKMKARASDYGLTVSRMNECLTQKNYDINRRITEIAKQRYGFKGTPSIYINGKFAGNSFSDLPAS